MEPVITKFDDNALKITSDPIVKEEIMSLEDIQGQLAHIQNSLTVLNEHNTYYEGLLAEAVKLNLKTKEELKENPIEDPIEEIIPENLNLK